MRMKLGSSLRCMRGEGETAEKRGSDWTSRKLILLNEDSQALEQVTHRGCAVAVLGGFQDPTGAIS